MPTALITGATSGLGRVLADRLKDTHELILIGRNHAVLEELAKSYGARIFSLDVRDAGALEKGRETLEAEGIRIDDLINCAGVGYFGPLGELSIDAIDAMIDINLKGPIYMARLFGDLIDGRLINIISTAGLVGKTHESVYCASKFGLRGFSEALQHEDHPFSVHAVFMGGMRTAFWEHSDHIEDKSRLRDPAVVADYILSHLHQNEIIVP